MSTTVDTVSQQLLEAMSDALSRKQPVEALNLANAYCALQAEKRVGSWGRPAGLDSGIACKETP